MTRFLKKRGKMSIKILTISVLISLSANLFASDFAYKFCTPDKASSVEVRSNGSTVQVYLTTSSGFKFYISEDIIKETQITDKEILSILSTLSGKNLESGTSYLLENQQLRHIEFIGIDSTGDINLLEVKGDNDSQTVDYIGSVNSCN